MYYDLFSFHFQFFKMVLLLKIHILMNYNNFVTETVNKLNILNSHLLYCILYIAYNLFHCILL